MYLRLFSLGIISLLSTGIFAQQKTYTLTGDMGIQGGELFTYKLILEDSAGNYLSGYAYTYLTEGKDVKARVHAVIDRANKTLSIRENAITYNHGFKSRALICLVESDLKYDASVSALKGSLITRTAILGAECAKGSITFMQQAELDQLFGKKSTAPVIKDTIANKAEQTEKKAPARIVYDTATTEQRAAVVKQDLPKQITEGKEEVFYWNSDSIIIEIWDDNKVDNDRIRVEFNGMVALDNFTISRDKKVLQFPVGGNELNILSITALNEGNEPPNTVNMLLHDGSKTYEVFAYNRIGKKSQIRIYKK